jgi:hypothetical protein
VDAAGAWAWVVDAGAGAGMVETDAAETTSARRGCD